MSTTGMTIFCYTPEFEKMRAFCQQALGVEPRDAGPNWTSFALGNSNFALHRMGNQTDPLEVHLDFIVDDINEGVQRFEQAGAEVLRGVQDEAWGKSALVQDPEGRKITLIEYETD